MLTWAALAALVAIRNPGVWGYLLRRPFPVDGASLALWLSFGAWPAVLALALWAAGLGLGRRALLAAGARPDGGLDALAAAALGLGLLAQGVFLLGWAGALAPGPLTFLAALAAAAGLGALKNPKFRRTRLGRAEALGAGLLAFAAFHLLIVALAPPSAWDVRAYHLALPELYLRKGRLLEVPWQLHSHWPHLMEALYALPLAAGRDSAAALLHAGACVLLVVGVFLAGGGWPAALLLAGQPALLRVAPTAHADGACALFFLAAAIALWRWEETKRDGWLITAGLLAGFSVSSKLFGGAGAAAWTAWLAWRTRRPREACLFAACAALAVGPWLFRAWLATGDPLWPLLRLTPAAAELAARNARTNLWTWPPPAWLFTHDGPAFLLAPLAGLALLGKNAAKRPSRLEVLLWLPAPLLLLLALRQHEFWRYMMPAYAAAALSAGRFAAAAFSASRWRRLAAAGFILLGASPIFMLTQNNELFAVLGLRSAASPGTPPRMIYEDRTVDVSSFYREASALLPGNSRVLLFREVRGYGAGFDYMWGDPINQNVVDYRHIRDFDELRTRLMELGITHVLDHEGSHLYQEDPLYYDARTLNLMAGMLQRHARKVLSREGLVLYQLL
jgi:hypothetical protein